MFVMNKSTKNFVTSFMFQISRLHAERIETQRT